MTDYEALADALGRDVDAASGADLGEVEVSYQLAAEIGSALRRVADTARNRPAPPDRFDSQSWRLWESYAPPARVALMGIVFSGVAAFAVALVGLALRTVMLGV